VGEVGHRVRAAGVEDVGLADERDGLALRERAPVGIRLLEEFEAIVGIVDDRARHRIDVLIGARGEEAEQQDSGRERPKIHRGSRPDE
jgi:hypothetical protein